MQINSYSCWALSFDSKEKTRWNIHENEIVWVGMQMIWVEGIVEVDAPAEGKIILHFENWTLYYVTMLWYNYVICINAVDVASGICNLNVASWIISSGTGKYKFKWNFQRWYQLQMKLAPLIWKWILLSFPWITLFSSWLEGGIHKQLPGDSSNLEWTVKRHLSWT